MTLRLLSISTLILSVATSAQADFNVSNFEDVGLTTPNSYFNATPNLTNPTASSSGQFVSGGSSFDNNYTYSSQYSYGYWSGWSVSNQGFSAQPAYVNQSSTPDYNYEYISATGSGANGAGSPYAVAGGADANPSLSSSIINLLAGSAPVSVSITNTLYDVYSMTYGDGFAQAFTPGNTFVLTIYGYSGLNGTGSLIGTQQVTLASDSVASGLFILNTWETVNLSSLTGAQSLVFGTLSNDNDGVGDAVPSMFDLDNLTTFSPNVVPEPSSLLLCLSGIGIGSLVFRRVRSRKGLL